MQLEALWDGLESFEQKHIIGLEFVLGNPSRDIVKELCSKIAILLALLMLGSVIMPMTQAKQDQGVYLQATHVPCT